jgi:CRP/FNR family transcriptional regulator/CRP/FNR family cyclic AMP-dependent transcriptional regulator
VSALAGSPDRRDGWLPGLSAEAMTTLAQGARKRSYRRGDAIVRKGDPGDSMFLILTGQVKIVLPSEEGEEAILGVLDAGECFGELSLLDGEPRSATVVATDPTEVLVVDREQFLAAVAANPRIAIDLLRILAGRLRETDEAVEDAVFLDVPARLAKRLLELAQDYGGDGAEGTEIGLKLTQADLAAMVGATRESINKHLSAFRARGVLDVRRGRIIIRRPEDLRRRIY